MQYLLKISYNGANYYGWAKQPDVKTIWTEMDNAVYKIFGKHLNIFASGRTDRYVHAIELPVLIRGDSSIPAEEVMQKLNELLPLDIRVNDIELVDDSFQVRFDAKGKKYRYLIDLSGTKDKDLYGYHTYPFNLEKMIETSKKFIGDKNFASFTAKESYLSFNREVTDITIEQKGDLVIFEITGKGFMRFMVRNIVGSLLAHNRGQVSDEELNDWLENPAKGKAHYKAEGSGLYLVEVYY